MTNIVLSHRSWEVSGSNLDLGGLKRSLHNSATEIIISIYFAGLH